MLITQLKSKETIASLVDGKKFFVINCQGCKEVHFPEKEAAELQKELGASGNMTGTITTDYICNPKNMVRNRKRDGWHEILKGDIFEDEDSDLLVCSTEEGVMTVLHDREYHEFVEKIFSDLHRMNERWYDAITITYLLGKPQKEVAENMGVSLEVLHSTLYRAKKWIQRKYREEYDRLNET